MCAVHILKSLLVKMNVLVLKPISHVNNYGTIFNKNYVKLKLYDWVFSDYPCRFFNLILLLQTIGTLSMMI